MAKRTHLELSRRERQIMEIIYRLGEVTVTDVRREIPDPLTYSCVRAFLRLLEGKGQVQHKKVGRKYVFSPTVPRKAACRSAVHNLLNTFFDGSIEAAVVSLIDMHAGDLSKEELNRLSKHIKQARKEGR